MSPPEKRAMGAAFVASMIVHLCCFLGAGVIIAFGLFSRAVEAQPPEPEVIYLSPEMIMVEGAPERQDPEDYLRTSANLPEDSAPEQTDFISDRNTTAMSRETQVEESVEKMPSQDGVDLPTYELEDRHYVDGALAEDATAGEDGAAAPSVAVTPQVEPSPLSADSAVLEDDAGEPMAVVDKILAEGEQPEVKQAEVLEEQPTELSEELPEVESNASKRGSMTKAEPDLFQPETRKAQVKGTISNRGEESAVNAKETPVGRYMREVTQAIEKRWHMKRKQHAEFVTYGNLSLRFFVNRSGRPEDLEITSKDANAVMADFTVGAVNEADIPPMPEYIVEILEGERLEVTYDIIIY